MPRAATETSTRTATKCTSAVAEYSLDPAGALYELHAPQIELPRLGSPKS